jgi:hypothetical protein
MIALMAFALGIYCKVSDPTLLGEDTLKIVFMVAVVSMFAAGIAWLTAPKRPQGPRW